MTAPGPIEVRPRARGLTAGFAWAYLVLVLGYTGALWTWGDSWWVATALLFGPRWPILLPAPFLLVAAFLLRPRLLLPLALALLTALGPALGYRTGWRRWLGSPPPALRVITFNIAAAGNPRASEVARDLEPYRADIVALQECREEVLAPERWPDGWTLRIDQSLCLATRFPVLDARAAPRVETEQFGETGRAMFYRLAGDSGPVDLVALHLETPRRGLESLRYGGDPSRMNPSLLLREIGSRRLSRWARQQSPDPVIVGDFNTPVESVIYRRYWGGCPNAFSTAGRGFGGTRVLRWFRIRIDHLLACGRWRPVRAFVGPDLGSDHLPVVVDLARGEW